MMAKPICVIVTGRPGSGKTTLSKNLARVMCMPLISRDELKEGYVNTFQFKPELLPEDSNRVASEFFFDIVERYLSGRVSILIEAAFQHQVWASRIDAIRAHAFAVAVVCSVDDQLAARRHLQRGLEDPRRELYHGDARVRVYRETGELAPPGRYAEPNLEIPTIHVRTEDGYSPTLEEIASWIQQSDAEWELAPDGSLCGPQVK
jgi:hypothetical protein